MNQVHYYKNVENNKNRTKAARIYMFEDDLLEYKEYSKSLNMSLSLYVNQILKEDANFKQWRKHKHEQQP